MQKKLFKHGGSFAVDLPISFIREHNPKIVVVERLRDRIVIKPRRELDTIEQEPEFKTFVAAILHDAMHRPNKLREVKEVWDKEWDALLKDVQRDED